MGKAVKKVTKELTFDERKTLCEKKLGEVLDEFQMKFSVEMVYAPQGIIPRLVFVDTAETEEDIKSPLTVPEVLEGKGGKKDDGKDDIKKTDPV